MLIKLFSIENSKIYRRMVIWIELFLFAGMAAGAYLLIGLSNPTSTALLLPEALNQSPVLVLTAGYSLGGLFFVVLVSASTAPRCSSPSSLNWAAG
jgi:hypothetical protein